MNSKETLFITEDGDHTILSDVQGNIYGIGIDREDCIDDAIEHGVYEEDLEGLSGDESHWWDDEEEDDYDHLPH